MRRASDPRPPWQSAPLAARVVAALGVLSVVLVCWFLEIGTNTIEVRMDGSETRTIRGEPIVETYMSSVHMGCVRGSCYPWSPRARFTIQGIFPGDGVSDSAAIVGGVLVPYLLLSASAYLVLRVVGGRTRLVIASSLAALAALLLVPPAIALYLAQISNGFSLLISDEGTFPQFLGFAILGSTSLGGSMWLFVRAFRRTAVQW